MATTASTISTLSICRAISPPPPYSSSYSGPCRLSPRFFPSPNPTPIAASFSSATNSSILRRLPLPITRKLQSFVTAAGEETLEVPEGEVEAAVPQPTYPPEPTDQTVSVTVSPSDILNMFFQAEGTMNETAIPTVTKALEETEGITDLRVQVLEGIASVELTKQTTVQATGVASNLIEIIQSKGFKLQTLNLSFHDEEVYS